VRGSVSATSTATRRATSGRETSSPHPQVSHPQPVEWHHGRPRTCIAPISLTTKVLQRSLLPPAHYWAIGAPVGGHSYSSAANGVKAGNTWIEVTWRYPSGGWVRSSWSFLRLANRTAPTSPAPVRRVEWDRRPGGSAASLEERPSGVVLLLLR
jgi:hypothetical protein